MSKRITTEILPENLLEHRAVMAWRQLSPEWPLPVSVEVLQLQRKSATYRLAYAASDRPTLIAKRCVTATARVERIIYEDFIAHLPAPALRYYGFVEEADGQCCWLFLEDAGRGRYSLVSGSHRALAGQWLAARHTAGMMAGLERRLPNRKADHYLNLLQSAREAIRRHAHNPALPPDDLRMLEALVADCDRLESRWSEVETICAGIPLTVVHGDFVIKNVGIRNTELGPALWAVDWEHAGWGVPAADMAQFTCRTVSPDLGAYGSVLRELLPGVTDRALRDLAHCGNFFRLLLAVSWESPLLTFRPYRYLSHPVSSLGTYQAWLHEALRTVGWT